MGEDRIDHRPTEPTRRALRRPVFRRGRRPGHRRPHPYGIVTETSAGGPLHAKRLSASHSRRSAPETATLCADRPAPASPGAPRSRISRTRRADTLRPPAGRSPERPRRTGRPDHSCDCSYAGERRGSQCSRQADTSAESPQVDHLLCSQFGNLDPSTALPAAPTAPTPPNFGAHSSPIRSAIMRMGLRTGCRSHPTARWPSRRTRHSRHLGYCCDALPPLNCAAHNPLISRKEHRTRGHRRPVVPPLPERPRRTGRPGYCCDCSYATEPRCSSFSNQIYDHLNGVIG